MACQLVQCSLLFSGQLCGAHSSDNIVNLLESSPWRTCDICYAGKKQRDCLNFARRSWTIAVTVTPLMPAQEAAGAACGSVTCSHSTRAVWDRVSQPLSEARLSEHLPFGPTL